MVFDLLKVNIDVSDNDFDSIYPESIKQLAKRHWTPVSVAKISSTFLVQRPGTRVLDIGSGAGKFCMVGAVNTSGHFTGVEQRLNLIKLSNDLSLKYGIRNVDFIHGNITSIRFSEYNSFYLFNPFHENIDHTCRIDYSLKFSPHLYHSYSIYVVEQLMSLPLGTRVATYHSPPNVVPSAYKLQDTLHGGVLKFWEKTRAGW